MARVKAKSRPRSPANGLLKAPPPAPMEPVRPSGWQRWVPSLSVFLAALVVYIPSLDNGFVSWDDDHYIYDNNQLVHQKGLADIWTNVKHTRFKGERDPRNRRILKDSTHQYYPLLFTMFWLEHRLYGDDPAVFKVEQEAVGYHATSMVLHAVNCVILLWLLQKLGVSVWAAWLVAALLAVHPMNVASVAWAAERKNLLALFFYMLAMMAYLRFRRKGKWAFYALTFVLFQCALWSKTVALTFPIVLLMTDRLIDRRWGVRSFARIAPMFLLSFIAAGTTMHVEDRNRSVPLVDHQRPFVAPATLWFYPAKLVAPVDQLPIYNLWNPDAIDHDRWQPAAELKWWVPLIGAIVAAWALVHWRRAITESVGPHFWWGLGFYLVTQLPMMGLKNINYFQFAYVADHYIYNGCAGVFLMLAVSADALRRRLGARGSAGHAVTAVALAALTAYGVKTWRYTDVWQDSESFWNATLAENPGCWPGWYNLGNHYKRQADRAANQRDSDTAQALWTKAAEHYAGAIRAKRNLHNGYEQLAPLLLKLDRKAELERYCDQEIALGDDVGNPYYYKGVLREEEGKHQEALDLYVLAIRSKKRLDADVADSAGIRAGICLMKLERWEEAIRFFEKAAERKPRDFSVRRNLGYCYIKAGRVNEAEAELIEALKLRPNDATVQNYLSELQQRK